MASNALPPLTPAEEAALILKSVNIGATMGVGYLGVAITCMYVQYERFLILALADREALQSVRSDLLSNLLLFPHKQSEIRPMAYPVYGELRSVVIPCMR